MTTLCFNTYETETEAGYGTASGGLRNSLYDEFDFFNGSPNVLNFLQPIDFKYGSNLTIGYTPWESTEFPTEWVDHIKRVDDMWTAASWIKPYFEDIRNKEVFVLPHGIDPCWTPIRHHRDESRPFVFVHNGGPAIRKGIDVVIKAWNKAFRYDRDVKLILKVKRFAKNELTNGLEFGENIEVISETYSREALWKLYALSDCMVYPSRGEGFGFIPLESMASALPTICTLKHMGDNISKYAHNLSKTKLVESQDQKIHPGKWIEPNVEELIVKMKYIRDNYEKVAHQSYQEAPELHDEFSWKNVQQKASQRINEMLR